MGRKQCCSCQNINVKQQTKFAAATSVANSVSYENKLCESMSSFNDMRNLLLFLYYSESISDKEFLTLYESYSSNNPDFPYSAYPKFDYDQIDESECLAEFRVRKHCW